MQFGYPSTTPTSSLRLLPFFVTCMYRRHYVYHATEFNPLCLLSVYSYSSIQLASRAELAVSPPPRATFISSYLYMNVSHLHYRCSNLNSFGCLSCRAIDVASDSSHHRDFPSYLIICFISLTCIHFPARLRPLSSGSDRRAFVCTPCLAYPYLKLRVDMALSRAGSIPRSNLIIHSQASQILDPLGRSAKFGRLKILLWPRINPPRSKCSIQSTT